LFLFLQKKPSKKIHQTTQLQQLTLQNVFSIQIYPSQNLAGLVMGCWLSAVGIQLLPDTHVSAAFAPSMSSA